MSQQLTELELSNLYELFLGAYKKQAILIDECGDFYSLYSKVKKFLVETQSPGENPEPLVFSTEELKYLSNFLAVTAERAGLGLVLQEKAITVYKKLNELNQVPEEKIQELE